MTPEEFVRRFVEPRIFPSSRRIYGYVLDLIDDTATGPWSRIEAEAAVRDSHGEQAEDLLATHLAAIDLCWSAAWPRHKQEAQPAVRRGRPRKLAHDVEVRIPTRWAALSVAIRVLLADEPTLELIESAEALLPPNRRALALERALAEERGTRDRGGDRRGLALTLVHPWLRPWEVAYCLDPKPPRLPLSDKGRALLILYERLGAPSESLESFARSKVRDPPWPGDRPSDWPERYPAFAAIDDAGTVHSHTSRTYSWVRGPILRDRYGRS